MKIEPITIPRPQIHTGPTHQTVDQATAAYLREAASRVRREHYWGSGVSTLVADLCAGAADVLDPLPLTEPHVVSLDAHPGSHGGRPGLRDRIALTGVEYWAGAALADAETKAALLGDGYVRVTRHADGTLTYASVDPTLITEIDRG